MKTFIYILISIAGFILSPEVLTAQTNAPLNLFYMGEFYAFGKTPQQILSFYGQDKLAYNYTDSGDRTLEHLSNGGLIIFYFDDDNRCNKIKAGELAVPFVNQLIHYCKSSLGFEYIGNNTWRRKKTNELFAMERAESIPSVIISYINRQGLRKIGKEHLLD